MERTYFILQKYIKHFIRFLKDNGAYNAFIHHYYYDAYGNRRNLLCSVMKYVDVSISINNSPIYIIGNAFSWPIKTYEFWNGLASAYTSKFLTDKKTGKFE